MAFDEHTWREKLSENLRGWKERMAKAGVKSVYAFLSAATLWPVAAAAQQEWAALMALVGVLGGAGSNLIANQIQQWKDEADGAKQLEATVEEDAELCHALDALLEKLDVLSEAESRLSKQDRSWFQKTLQEDLARLGSGLTYVGLRGVKAEDVAGSVITGDGNTIQQVTAGRTGDILGPGAVKKEERHYHLAPDKQQEAQQALNRYLNRLRKECSILPLAALGGDEDVEEDVTLDQVYIALNTRYWITQKELEALRSGQIDKWQEVHSRQEPKTHRFRLPGENEESLVPFPVWEAVLVAPKMAILGDPGSGKSTFVKRLVEKQAAVLLGEQEPIPHVAPDLMPVLLVLRDLVPDLQGTKWDTLSRRERDTRLLGIFNAHLEGEWRRLTAPPQVPAAPLQEALSSGRALLVLDGLDEVPLGTREAVRALVRVVRQAYEVQRVVVTSRIRSYSALPLFTDWPTVTLRPFNEEQITDFVHAWYKAQTQLGRFCGEEAEERAEDLVQATRSKDLLPLATNPILLTTMTLIHQREIELPDQRVKVYDMAVDILVRRWRKAKTGRLTPSEALEAFLQDDTRLRPALEHLAYEAHKVGTGKGTADIPREKAIGFLEERRYAGSAAVAEEFLDYVDQRAGLLVGRGGDVERPAVYSFPHRTFQEYLAGCYVMGQRGRERREELKKLAGQGDFWDLAVILGAEDLYFNRRRPDEVLDLAYALCPEREPRDERDWRWTLWSGDMALLVGLERVEEDGEYGGPRCLSRMRQRLVASLKASALLPAERARAGETLAALGDPRFAPDCWYLPREPLLGFVPIPEGEFIMGSDPKKERWSDEEEQPRHRLHLPAYYIARYPVTVGQWRAFVKANPDYPSRFDPDSLRDPDNRPVRWVTWYDALAYARWLDERLRDMASEMLKEAQSELEQTFWRGLAEGRYHVTLPSEAEWEKATRGGVEIPEHPFESGDGCLADLVENPDPDRIYPWGNEPDPNRANYDQTGIVTTSAVGCFPGGESPYGVEEMSGNVWEWTRSLWGREWGKPDYSYPYEPMDGRENLDASSSVDRVLRGGSFVNDVRNVRCVVRDGGSPSGRSRVDGFRVVVSPFGTDR